MTVYEEIAEEINAKQSNRARKVCEAVLSGEVL